MARGPFESRAGGFVAVVQLVHHMMQLVAQVQVPLHEIATLSGIPGKLDVDGNQVAELWLAGDLRRIVEYNEFDALTPYLLWLRVAHFAGHFTPEEYAEEQEALRRMVEDLAGKRAHLARYLDEWQRLRAATGNG